VLQSAAPFPETLQVKRLETEVELTLRGQLLGSPNYMPPEQAAAKRGAVGKRSDVYAMGAILYHLLTGRPPFLAPTVAETLQEVLNTEPVSPRVLNPGVPPDLETLCLKCLDKEPARRYQAANELAEELDRFLREV
jgi:serine/threonine-protein kinase